jgi:glycosyltransferase involved in cell wall biosynthesis
MAVLEAMALGCPVIASEVGGIPEVIRDGHNGLLFPMGDAAALAAQLRRILDGPDLAARLGSTAAEDCSGRFDATRLAARTAEFYHQVLQSYRPPARHHHQATRA